MDYISYQAKAFVLMPLAYNIAAILSPMVAGLLVDLPGQYPQAFGPDSFFRHFPYAPPATASAMVVLIAFLLVFFKLKEVRVPLSPHSASCEKTLVDNWRSLIRRTRQHVTSTTWVSISQPESLLYLRAGEREHSIHLILQSHRRKLMKRGTTSSVNRTTLS